MHNELKLIASQIISETPNGYMNRIKRELPDLIDYVNTLPHKTLGERFYNWYYPNAKNTCSACNSRCTFKQFSHGYYTYCSPSCRAKDKQSYKNAHDSNGKCKGVSKIKAAAEDAVYKRKNTVLANTGSSLSEYATKSRHDSYVSKLPSQLKDVQFCTSNTKPLSVLAAELGVPTYTVKRAFKQFGIDTTTHHKAWSNQELEVGQFLTDLGVSYERNVRGLLDGRQEIDIFIPSINVGIEYCGLFWHSDRNKYPASKHQDKFITAVSKGIKLITLFEDEWLFKKDVVKSRLTSLVRKQPNRIHGRKCIITTVLSSVANTLLTQWHIAGTKSSATNLCLSYDNEVVAVMTYGKPRYNKHADLEIIRYATKPGATVVGGFSKLFARLVAMTQCTSVVSYSDNRWGTGEVYTHAGFINGGITAPSYYYFTTKDRVRYHRSAFMKHKIVRDMKGDINLTEYENMKRFGYNRIFDCGTTKWMWEAAPNREAVEVVEIIAAVVGDNMHNREAFL